MALFLKLSSLKFRMSCAAFISKKSLLASCNLTSKMMCGDQFRYRFYSDSRDLGRYESIEARTVESSPSRSRDLSGETLRLHDQAEDAATRDSSSSVTDDHVGSYDAHGSISLNSAMQSNVPEPFNVDGKSTPTHLNMPGGHVSQSQKYLSDHMNNAHYARNVKSSDSVVWAQSRWYCSKKDAEKASAVVENERQPSKGPRATSKLKQAVKDYGTTVIVVHVVISLVSLGGFYLAVESGVNVLVILEYLGLQATAAKTNYVAGVSTFIIAYTVHKVLAPARIAFTLAVTPYIVRQLRRMRIVRSRKKAE